MSDITKGVLIYNEWFEAMRALDPDNFKKIVLAVYDFQIHDIPPPEFDGVALAIASIIFPYIERRKQKAENGRLGAAARYLKEYGQPSCDDALANGSANGSANSYNKSKLNKTKSIYNQNKATQAAYPTAAGGMGRSGGFAAAKRATGELQSFDTDEFFAAAVKRSLELEDI